MAWHGIGSNKIVFDVESFAKFNPSSPVAKKKYSIPYFIDSVTDTNCLSKNPSIKDLRTQRCCSVPLQSGSCFKRFNAVGLDIRNTAS